MSHSNGSTLAIRPLESVLECLSEVTPVSDHSWKAICPLHDDHKPSLQITEAQDGKVLMFCHVCGDKSIGPKICNHFGLPIRSLFPDHGRPAHGGSYSRGRNGNGKARQKTSPPKGAGFDSSDAVICYWEKEIGKPRTADFPYHDADGQHVRTVIRFDFEDGKKTFRQATLIDGRWHSTGMLEPHPLYGLPELLASNGRKWITEGEGKCNLLRNLGLPATTSAHGAGSAAKHDWTPLAGSDCVIWPDNDPNGKKYQVEVTEILKRLDPSPSIRVVAPKGLPEKGDAKEWLQQRDAADTDTILAELNAMADAAEIVSNPDDKLPEVLTIGQLIEEFPNRRPVVIDGVLRQGEIANWIAKAKVGKSWGAYQLGLSVVGGLDWLGQFRCEPGNVLLLDNELHREDIAQRVPAVAEALGIYQSDFHDRFHVLSLRGRHRDIFKFRDFFDNRIRGKYSLVIVDALYRMFPPDMSENDNAAMAQLYNQVDNYADATGSAFILVHHSSKGSQGDKDTVDVGSGASSQARAADTHLIMRPHTEDGCVVLDAAVRSFEPVTPLVLRWEFPLWVPELNLDPASLKTAKSAKAVEDRQQRLDEKRQRVVDFLARADIRDIGATQSKIRDHTGVRSGLGEVLDSLTKDGNLVRCSIVHDRNKQSFEGWKLAQETE